MSEIKLAVAIQRLNLLNLNEKPIEYNRALRAVISGQIPAVLRGGRWYVSERDLPAAAQWFAANPPRRRRDAQ